MFPSLRMRTQTTSLNEEDITLLKSIGGSQRASWLGQAGFSIPGLFLIVVPFFPAAAKMVGAFTILLMHLIFSFYRRQRNRIHRDLKYDKKNIREGYIQSTAVKGSTITYIIDGQQVSVKLPTGNYDYTLSNIKTIGGPATLETTEVSQTLLRIEYPVDETIQIKNDHSQRQTYINIQKTLIIAGSALVIMALLVLFDVLVLLLFWVLAATAIILFLIIYSVYLSERKDIKKSTLLTISGTVTETMDFRIMAGKTGLKYGQFVRLGPYLLTNYYGLKIPEKPLFVPGDTVSAKAIIKDKNGSLEQITVL